MKDPTTLGMILLGVLFVFRHISGAIGNRRTLALQKRVFEGELKTVDQKIKEVRDKIEKDETSG